MINCVIIEDEPLAQNGLINLIKPYASLNILAVCDNVEDFLQFQNNNKDKTTDLIFLDIELPGMNGINFLRAVKPDIPIVLTTAYNEFAIEGYELNVLDYLLKPISKARFAQAILKAEQYIGFLNQKSNSEPDFMYIKSDKVLEKISFSEIILVEAMRNYVIYECDKRKLVCYTSLKRVEQLLPSGQFIKIQKSFIVNKNKIDKIEKGSVFINNKNISINRENRSAIVKRLTEV
jgi:two-component system LytT family response regulator